MAGFHLAVIAGVFAALASVTSKLAFEPSGTTLRGVACVFLRDDYCSKVDCVCMTQEVFSVYCVYILVYPNPCLEELKLCM